MGDTPSTEALQRQLEQAYKTADRYRQANEELLAQLQAAHADLATAQRLIAAYRDVLISVAGAQAR